MKKLSIFICPVLVIFLSTFCTKISDSKRNDFFVPEDSSPGENSTEVEGRWKIDTIVTGAVWKNFTGVDLDVTKENQIVNVLEIDLTNPKLHVKFHYGNIDGLRATDAVFGNKKTEEGAIGCINATYEVASSYIRTNYTTYCNIESSVVPDSKVRQWKFEASVTTDGDRDVRIEYTAPAESNDYQAARAAYDLMTDRPNLFSAAPMLVTNGTPVGETFTDRMIESGLYGGKKGMTNNEILRLDYENPIRHQGVRHPRTAVAITSGKKFLMVTIDGRWTAAKGMTAKEATKFLMHHFPDITDAMNMDGGGSTCMCVLGRGDASNNVVNYPAQDDTFDHLGIRAIPTHIYVTYADSE